MITNKLKSSNGNKEKPASVFFHRKIKTKKFAPKIGWRALAE